MPGKLFYSDEEKDLVTELVRKYKFSIENKKSDTVSLSRKMKAWDALTAEFNSAENVRPRTVSQLRKLWDNLKQRWKKEKAKQIRDAMATGEIVLLQCLPLCSSQCLSQEVGRRRNL